MSTPDGATNRYSKYYQTSAATDRLHSEDYQHLIRADNIIASGNSPYKKVRVDTTFSAETPRTISGLGFCVRRVLREVLGIDVVNLPGWITMTDLRAVCQELGLVMQTGPAQIEITVGKRYIVIYPTQEGKAHAIISKDLRTQVSEGKHIVAIIEVPE